MEKTEDFHEYKFRIPKSMLANARVLSAIGTLVNAEQGTLENFQFQAPQEKGEKSLVVGKSVGRKYNRKSSKTSKITDDLLSNVGKVINDYCSGSSTGKSEDFKKVMMEGLQKYKDHYAEKLKDENMTLKEYLDLQSEFARDLEDIYNKSYEFGSNFSDRMKFIWETVSTFYNIGSKPGSSSSATFEEQDEDEVESVIKSLEN